MNDRAKYLAVDEEKKQQNTTYKKMFLNYL